MLVLCGLHRYCNSIYLHNLFQVLVSISALTLLHVLNVVPLRRYSRSLGEKMLVPSICSSIHAVLAMWAKANSSDVGLFPLLLPLLPLATLGFSLSQKLASSPSLHISALISILGGTSFVVSGKKSRCYFEWELKVLRLYLTVSLFLIAASQGLSGVGLLEYMYAPLALILHSLSLTFLAKASEAERRRRPPEAQASIFDIYYTQLVNQSCVLGLLWLLHPQSPWLVLSHSNWQSLLFHGYLLAILLLGTLLDLLVGVSALCVSPFAAALLHSARQLAQPLLQLL